jgi:hypothetical protein
MEATSHFALMSFAQMSLCANGTTRKMIIGQKHISLLQVGVKYLQMYLKEKFEFLPVRQKNKGLFTLESDSALS